MPLQKLQFRPGINRDATSLATEGGWYTCDKVRFRSGFPEKIGGWARISEATYLGICRTLAVWRTLKNFILTGAGTHLKMYVESGGGYNDITPVRASQTVVSGAFTTTNGSTTVVVNATAHGAIDDAFVLVTGSVTDVGGILAANFNTEFRIVRIDDDMFQIELPTAATSTVTGGNGAFEFLLNPGKAYAYFTYGWGAAAWSAYAWGTGYEVGYADMRAWTQVPYGELLVFGPKLGGIYLFSPDPDPTVFNRGVLVSSLPGASSVPAYQFDMILEQAARILVVFGTHSYLDVVYNPLLVRWSDADSFLEWAPAITNQAGEYVLPSGSSIVTALHTRQETVILTDTALYTMQYVGAPIVFSFAMQSDNISVAGPLCATTNNGIVYWMGREKFYIFDGRVQTLDCSLLDEVFDDFNAMQAPQVVAGTNEGFDEVWWFYCSRDAMLPDRYVIYNYTLKAWTYGNMQRTAWVDSPLKQAPLAAPPTNSLVMHEIGVDDLSGDSTVPLNAFIESSAFDIGDGHNFGFVRRILPDLTFTGSTAFTPSVQMSLATRNNPGAAPNAVGGGPVNRMAVDQWTEQVFVRVRGRQMNLRIESLVEGVQWKIGTPRIDVRPDGRRA